MRLNMGEFRVIWILNIPYIIFTNSIVKKLIKASTYFRKP